MIVQNVSQRRHDRGQLHGRQGRPARNAPRRRDSPRAISAPPRLPTTPTSPRSRSLAWACAPTPASPPRMFEVLAAAGINIQMITTSEIKISVLVDRHPPCDGVAGYPPRVLALEQLNSASSAFTPSSPTQARSRAMKLVPLVDVDAEPGAGQAPASTPPNRTADARNGRPGDRRSRARRVASPGCTLSRPRPPGLRRAASFARSPRPACSST